MQNWQCNQVTFGGIDKDLKFGTKCECRIETKLNYMTNFYFIPFILFFNSCVSESSNENNAIAKLEQKMNHLNQEVDSLKSIIEKLQSTSLNDFKMDTLQTEIDLQTEKMDAITEKVPDKTKKKTPKEKPSKVEKEIEKTTPQTTALTDTIYHYYVNGMVSVKIFPWENNERTIQLFNLYGEKTYETKDIKLSFSVINHLSFHSNGGVSKIVESTNPGASMYMYKATMKFSTTNDPEIRTETKTPTITLEDAMNEKIPLFWNKKKQIWIKQEVSIESEIPEEYRK